MAQIDTLWNQWAKIRDQQLAGIKTLLLNQGLPPVTVPSADQLVIKPPEGGEDLP